MLGKILVFLFAVVFARGIGMLQSFALAKALNPDSFGAWITLMVVVSFCPILALGTLEAMVKEVPYHIGRGDTPRVKELESSVFGAVVLVAGGCLAIGAGAWLIFPNGIAGIPSACLFLLFLTVGVSSFSSFFYWRFTAYEDFKNTGMVDLIRAVFAFGFVVGLGFTFGLTGAVVGLCVHEIVVCMFTIRRNVHTHGKVGVSFNTHLIGHAIRVGLPITLLWWVLALQAGVDRIVIGRMLDSAAVGYYGIGISITGGLALVPMVVGRVLYPMVNREFGRSNDLKGMAQLVLSPTYSLGLLLVNCQLLLVAITPLLYVDLYPQYKAGLAAGQVFISGCYFVCLLRNGANFLIATHKEKLFLGYILFALAFNLLLACGCVRIGLGLTGVALSTSLAGLLLSLLVWWRVLIGLGLDGFKALRVLASLHVPILLLVSFLGLVRATSPLLERPVDLLRAVPSWLAMFLLLNACLYCLPAFRTEMVGFSRRVRHTMVFRKRGVVRNPGGLPAAK